MAWWLDGSLAKSLADQRKSRCLFDRACLLTYPLRLLACSPTPLASLLLASLGRFLAYSKNFETKNPFLAEGFALMSRGEARHEGFLYESMSDFGSTLHLGFLITSRKKKSNRFLASLRLPSWQIGMKRDMGGAAAVLAAFQAAVKAQNATAEVGRSGRTRHRSLHALLCLAENSVASNATRPDDVHTLYSGRTVRTLFFISDKLIAC